MHSVIGSSRRWRLALAAIGFAACSPSSLVDVDPTSTLVDPSTVGTAAGAVQLYNFALGTFAARLGGTGGFVPGANNLIVATGLLTDEMMRAQALNNMIIGLDERTGASGFASTAYGLFYVQLHQPRVQAYQAREALRLYAPGSLVLQGEMFALEAFTLVYFAEVFCSGIPLTVVPLHQEAVPTAGFATQELLERAVAMFDSAIVLAGDSARVADLARVGRGRALLSLGRLPEAAAAVSVVPTNYVYRAEFAPTANRQASLYPPANELGGFVGASADYRAQVVDNEGGNGLSWSTDPRTGIMTAPQFGAMLLMAKYSRTSAGVLQTAVTVSDNPIRVADGLEARLIEAEAALSGGDANWLTTLNTLRSTCIGTQPCAPVPGLTSSSLPALSDPGSAAARLDLVMRERAMWLYLTGHRQGDLRRMARHYGRPRETLWPTGTYVNLGFPPNIGVATTHGTAYGSDVVFTPNPSEQLSNNLYQGCFSLDP